MNKEFQIRRTADGEIGLFFGPHLDPATHSWANFPAFLVPTVLDMKEILVDLLKQCQALEEESLRD